MELLPERACPEASRPPAVFDTVLRWKQQQDICVFWQISLEASRFSQASPVFGTTDPILLPLASNDNFQGKMLL
jgi:hypothetical protein